MTADAGADSALDLAARRLERAIALLEQRLAHRVAEASVGAGAAFDEDRTRLAAQLDNARARERQLEEAGAAASAALGEGTED
jgi:hypothetical protein